MKQALIIFLLVIFSVPASAQTRKNFIYASFLKFPESHYNVALGLDHAIKISRKDWTSARLYLVASPNFFWSGYKFKNLDDQDYLRTKFEKFEIAVPLHLRFEFSPYRIDLKKEGKKIGNDVALFFDAGLSANYLLGAHLKEEFNYADQSTSFQYSFDGSLTSSIQTRLTFSYLHFNMGFRLNRFLLLLRFYQTINETQYKNRSEDWGLPNGTRSYFYDVYLRSSFHEQYRQMYLLCIGYSF